MKKRKVKKVKKQLTILEFIRHPQLLDDQSNSTAQDTILKSTYGLELNEAESEIYRRATGRDYVAREQREITTLAGRRGGKSAKIGARIALYEAFRDHRLPRGERAYVLLIASSLEQAEIAYDYICKDIRSSSILLKKIARFRKNEIVLKNGITICCCTCSSISVRGRSVVAAICDEVCFWRNEVTSVHCDEEVLAALRPAMIQFQKSKLIKISTPHAKRGVIWEEYRRRAELNYPIFQLATLEMNPDVPAELLEQERERSLERFKREFLAEFTDNVVSWIAPEYLDACIVPDRRQLPRVSDGIYVAAVDPAFKQSDFALAIAHRTSVDLIVIDRVARWTGSTKAPLGFERVCREIAEILREYGIDKLQGDQLAAAIIQQEFLKLNLTYREVTFNRQTRVRLFNNLKHLLQQRRIELLDQPEPLRQLRSLEESLAADGSIDVRPDYGKDDLAIVLGMCALELSQSSCIQLPAPITFGRAPRPWDGFLPSRVSERGGFPVGQNCAKYPKCWEVGPCECYGIE
jgi:hypothetical protein